MAKYFLVIYFGKLPLAERGGWGGARDSRFSLGQNFFIFMQFSEKNGQNSRFSDALLGVMVIKVGFSRKGGGR